MGVYFRYATGYFVVGIFVTLGAGLAAASVVKPASPHPPQVAVNYAPSPAVTPIASPIPGAVLAETATPAGQSTVRTSQSRSLSGGLRFVNAGLQINVYDDLGWAATFTRGARTVTLRGPSRTFAEPAHTTATVTHNVWVRALAGPFGGAVDQGLLSSLLANSSPDILAISMEYIAGGPHDADYGPLLDDGSREEGSDYNDFLGITINYPDGADAPEARQIGALDCSGYVRMVWGYRAGLPLARLESPSGAAIPRRAVNMAAAAPGPLLIPRTGRVTDYSALRPGDIVFFDVSTNDGADIDHVGMYLGLDNQGFHRFISSRKTANGPTMGDDGGRSALDGSGIYASHFVAMRRF